MGQAKTKRDKEKKHEGMRSFSERLQSDVNDVVKSAEYLVENGVAKWQIVMMQDGITSIALIFKSSIWKLEDHKLTLKVPQTVPLVEKTSASSEGE